jgi:hypothetical protein
MIAKEPIFFMDLHKERTFVSYADLTTAIKARWVHQSITAFFD